MNKSKNKTEWKKANGTRGVRYYEHVTRKHKGKPDRYYSVRWYRQSKTLEEGIGWSSEGWKISEIVNIRHKLQQNYKSGVKPSNFTELKDEHLRKKLKRKPKKNKNK